MAIHDNCSQAHQLRSSSQAHQASQVMLPSTAFILFAEAHQAEASHRIHVI